MSRHHQLHHQVATTSHPLQPVVRNPWLGESDTTSSSDHRAHAHVPRHDVHSHLPPRLEARVTRSRASSIASSHRASNLPHAGCCSPGVQLVCYFCVRAALLASLLGGAALAIAGVVLRQQLGVLLYIGVLSTLVSALLLAVQQRARRPRASPEDAAIPLQRLATASTARGSDISHCVVAHPQRLPVVIAHHAPVS